MQPNLKQTRKTTTDREIGIRSLSSQLSKLSSSLITNSVSNVFLYNNYVSFPTHLTHSKC